MTLPAAPLIVRNAATLSPALVNHNLDLVARDLGASMDARYFESSFELDFTGVASTAGAEELKFFLRPPFYFEIIGVELEVYVATANVSAVAIQASGAGLTGWEDVSVAPAGAALRARGEANFVAANTAATEVGFTLAVTSTGAWTLDGCRVVVHIRTDRGNAGASHAGYAPTHLAAGAAVARAALNTELAAAAAAVARDTANDKAQRIQVISKRQLASGFSVALRDVRIPASSRRLNSMDVVSVAAATNDLTVAYLDAAAATVATGSAAGAGVGVPTKTYVTAGLPSTQSANAPATAASDYLFRFSRSGAGVANILLGYVAAYWT